jgi:3-dehydroquinate dehydratase II
MKITVINGPNLNLLGVREPHIYGTESLADIEKNLREVAKELSVEVSFVQSNSEGDLVDAVQALRTGAGKADAAIINAGAYSHTSLALQDAFKSVSVPFVEVHLSNIFAREPERHHSMLAPIAKGLICGLGSYGYELALRALAK